jgi:hypothetical protein
VEAVHHHERIAVAQHSGVQNPDDARVVETNQSFFFVLKFTDDVGVFEGRFVEDLNNDFLAHQLLVAGKLDDTDPARVAPAVQQVLFDQETAVQRLAHQLIGTQEVDSRTFGQLSRSGTKPLRRRKLVLKLQRRATLREQLSVATAVLRQVSVLSLGRQVLSRGEYC